MTFRPEPIEGSKYFRGFCALCNEPIRVAYLGEQLCHLCSYHPLQPNPFTVAHEVGYVQFDEAVKAIETFGEKSGWRRP